MKRFCLHVAGMFVGMVIGVGLIGWIAWPSSALALMTIMDIFFHGLK